MALYNIGDRLNVGGVAIIGFHDTLDSQGSRAELLRRLKLRPQILFPERYVRHFEARGFSVQVARSGVRFEGSTQDRHRMNEVLCHLVADHTGRAKLHNQTVDAICDYVDHNLTPSTNKSSIAFYDPYYFLVLHPPVYTGMH